MSWMRVHQTRNIQGINFLVGSPRTGPQIKSFLKIKIIVAKIYSNQALVPVLWDAEACIDNPHQHHPTNADKDDECG